MYIQKKKKKKKGLDRVLNCIYDFRKGDISNLNHSTVNLSFRCFNESK